MKFSHVYSAFLRQPWAITDEMYDVIGALLLERLNGNKPDLETIEARIEATGPYGSGEGGVRGREHGGVALITLHGVIFSRAQALERMSGATHPQVFAKLIEQAARDPAISSIVIGVDSPGGTVAGLSVAAEAVRRARERKQVIAVVDDMACSAAYWIAAQASEVVVPEGGIVGSIGVVATHLDVSKRLAAEGIKPTVLRSADLKALGSSVEPLEGKALGQWKADIQRYHDQFVQEVAQGRRVSAETASAWATGETWMGAEAVRLGLADRLGSLSSVLEALQGQAETPAPEGTPLEPDDLEDLSAQTTPAAEVQTLPPPPPAPPSIPNAQTPQGGTMNLNAILAKVRAGIALTAEEASFLEARVTTPEAANIPDPLATLPAEARALLEQANARATRAEEAANAERTIRLTSHFGTRAAELGLEAAMGPVLMRASGALSKEDYEALEQSYRARAEQDKAAALFAVRGGSHPAPGTAKAEVQAQAQSAMAENPKLTYLNAEAQVLAANPALAARLMQEQASSN